MPGDFTLDSYFTSAKSLNHIQSTQCAYVGDLQLNRQVVYAGREQKLQEVAWQSPWEAKKPVRMGKYTVLVLQQTEADGRSDAPGAGRTVLARARHAEASKALVRNRLGWEVICMVLGYRHRWTETETFHRDGKQQLGLGDCQVRSGERQTRHVYLVSAAYSLLMRSLQQNRMQDWARRTLTTIGEACRAVQAETVERMIDWVVDKLRVDHWAVIDIKAVLAYA